MIVESVMTSLDNSNSIIVAYHAATSVMEDVHAPEICVVQPVKYLRQILQPR